MITAKKAYKKYLKSMNNTWTRSELKRINTQIICASVFQKSHIIYRLPYSLHEDYLYNDSDNILLAQANFIINKLKQKGYSVSRTIEPDEDSPGWFKTLLLIQWNRYKC